MSRRPWPLLALATLAVIATGCGSASAGTGDGGNSAAAPAGSHMTAGHGGTTTPRERAVKFAECMRANGVNGFPDPNASGDLTIDAVANGSSVDTNSAAFKQAMNVCKGLEPSGFTGGKVTASQRTARLAFAQCMRENGVPDFPDPTPNEPLVDTYRIPSSNTTAGMTILNAAMHTCGARFSGRLGVKRQ